MLNEQVIRSIFTAPNPRIKRKMASKPKKIYSEEKKKAVLLDLKNNGNVKDIAEKHGISDKTVYRWENDYADR